MHKCVSPLLQRIGGEKLSVSDKMFLLNVFIIYVNYIDSYSLMHICT